MLLFDCAGVAVSSGTSIALWIRDDRRPSIVFPTHLGNMTFPYHLVSLFITGRTDCLLPGTHGDSLPGLIL